MPSKAVTMSVRLSQEDTAFIGQLDIEGAKTPSDKLRAIITEARRRSEGPRSFLGSLQMMRELLGPVSEKIRQLELENKMHSELVNRPIDWLPDMVAFIVSTVASTNESDTKNRLYELEQGTSDRLFRLMESILQMGITPRCPCYSSDAIAKRIEPLLDITSVIQQQRHAK